MGKPKWGPMLSNAEGRQRMQVDKQLLSKVAYVLCLAAKDGVPSSNDAVLSLQYLLGNATTFTLCAEVFGLKECTLERNSEQLWRQCVEEAATDAFEGSLQADTIAKGLKTPRSMDVAKADMDALRGWLADEGREYWWRQIPE